VLKTIPWGMVNMKVVGAETAHAGEVFDGSREEIDDLMIHHGYRNVTMYIQGNNHVHRSHDSFYYKQ